MPSYQNNESPRLHNMLGLHGLVPRRSRCDCTCLEPLFIVACADKLWQLLTSKCNPCKHTVEWTRTSWRKIGLKTKPLSISIGWNRWGVPWCCLACWHSPCRAKPHAGGVQACESAVTVGDLGGCSWMPPYKRSSSKIECKAQTLWQIVCWPMQMIKTNSNYQTWLNTLFCKKTLNSLKCL